MQFLEKDLENIIWETDNEKLQEKELYIEGKKFRQMRIGNYGVCDILTIQKEYCYSGFPYLNITVYELKKEKAGISAFLQAVRYTKGISDYLTSRSFKGYYKFNIVLISKEIDTSSDYIFLTDFINSDNVYSLNSLKNYSFTYNIDGILFKEESGYSLSNKGF